jgi:hypothetical protein
MKTRAVIWKYILQPSLKVTLISLCKITKAEALMRTVILIIDIVITIGSHIRKHDMLRKGTLYNVERFSK